MAKPNDMDWGDFEGASDALKLRLANVINQARRKMNPGAPPLLPDNFPPPTSLPEDNPIRESLGGLASQAWVDKNRQWSAASNPSSPQPPGDRTELEVGRGSISKLNMSLESLAKMIDEFARAGSAKVKDIIERGVTIPRASWQADPGRQGVEQKQEQKKDGMPSVWPATVRDFSAGKMLTFDDEAVSREDKLKKAGMWGGLAMRKGGFRGPAEDAEDAMAGNPQELMVRGVILGAKMFVKHLQAGAAHTVAALGAEKFHDVGGHMAGATRHFGSAVGLGHGPGNPAGTIAALGTLGEVALNTAGAIKSWSDHMHSANVALAEFSPSMMAVKQVQEVRDQILNLQRGERRAPVAEGLAESKNRLEVQTSRWEDWWADRKGEMVGQSQNWQADLINLYTEGLDEWRKNNETVDQILTWLKVNTEKQEKTRMDRPTQDMMDGVEKFWDGRWTAPPRFLE